ncbi:Integrase core domain [Popillia japonica]|uniref:Integrase core domain n=1 Tax=Popillia japonica TaxID=7064 RepID=A0AAW1KGB4_POPJA
MKEPLIPHERPNIPFAKIGSDVLEYRCKSYLVVVDYYSNWIELVPMESKTAGDIVKQLKIIFSKFGVPHTLVSDNMPYSSYEFKKFAKEWNFNICTSSPRYPKSNGLAERAVGICKGMLRKCDEAGVDIELALLEYRTTPDCYTYQRTAIPTNENLLKIKEQRNVEIGLEEVKSRQKEYYNKGAKERKEFESGDLVALRENKIWIPGKIIEKHNAPRSYIVKDQSGRVLRRNSSHLKKTNIPFVEQKRDVEIEAPPQNNNSNNIQTVNGIEYD